MKSPIGRKMQFILSLSVYFEGGGSYPTDLLISSPGGFIPMENPTPSSKGS